jgi:predicted nucleic acid-binding protein
VDEARLVIDRHRDLEVGIADASIVVLSRRLETRDLLSLDGRHFRVLTGFRNRRFRLLPADS